LGLNCERIFEDLNDRNDQNHFCHAGLQVIQGFAAQNPARRLTINDGQLALDGHDLIAVDSQAISLIAVVRWQNRRAAGLQIAYAREENAAIIEFAGPADTRSFFPRRAINFFSRVILKTRRRFPKTASGLPDRTQDLPAGDLGSKP